MSRDAKKSLADGEWQQINLALKQCRGNVTQAADLLGIDRRTLQRKLKRRRLGG